MNRTIKQTLLGPGVVGCLFGLVAGFAAFGFQLEYGPHIQSEQQPVWLYAADQAALSFVAIAAGTVIIFGVAPLLIRKASSK